jgi:hypothetical protein
VLPPTGATWAEALTIGVATFVVSLAATGLVLAMLGGYTPDLGLGLGIVVGSVLAAAVVASLRPWERRSRWAKPTLVALLVVIGWFVWNAAYSSELVWIDRDPSVYATTARWLASDGSLLPEPADGAFADVPDIGFGSLATFVRGDGRLEFQFQHAVSVLLADGYGLGGTRALFWLTPLAGALALFAVFLVASRVLRSGWFGLASVVVAGLLLPQIVFSRGTYSEPYVQLLLWTGLSALGLAFARRGLARRHLPVAFVGGTLVGGVALARIDGIVVLTPLVLLAGARLVRAAATDDRPAFRSEVVAVLAAGAGAGVMLGLGLLDLTVFGSVYWESHRSQVRSLFVVLAVSILGSAAAVVAARIRPRAFRHLRWPGGGAASVLSAVPVVGLLLAWVVRPHVQTSRGGLDNPVVAGAQRADGLAVDSSRLYAEQSMNWLSWYVGVVGLALALVGLFVLLRRLLVGRGRALEWLFAGTFLAVTLLYLARPSITPDQIWATRRFVPLTLPGLALLAVLPLARLWQLDPWPRWRLVARAATVAMLAAVLVSVLSVTWPMREARQQAGYLGVIEEVCALVPADTAILVVPGGQSTSVAQSLRSWCERPVAVAVPTVTGDDVRRIAEAVGRNGYRLALVSILPEPLDDLGLAAEAGGQARAVTPAESDAEPERRILGPPRELDTYVARLAVLGPIDGR